jgi:hypothetical protein
VGLIDDLFNLSRVTRAELRRGSVDLSAVAKWLDDATKTIGQYWPRKNARPNGLITENLKDNTSGHHSV